METCCTLLFLYFLSLFLLSLRVSKSHLTFQFGNTPADECYNNE